MLSLNAQRSVKIYPTVAGESSPADSDGSPATGSGRVVALNTRSNSNKFSRTNNYRRRSKDFSSTFGDTVSQRYRGNVSNSSFLSQASQISNGTNANGSGGNANEASSGLENLINYLTSNVDNIKSTRSYQREFEEMTHSLLQVSHDPELLRVLKNHGWMGHRFRNSDDAPLDPHLLLQALSNIYLKHQVSHYGAHISSLLGGGESRSADQIMSFVPDSLIEFLKANVALMESQSQSAPANTPVDVPRTSSAADVHDRDATDGAAPRIETSRSDSSVPSIDAPHGADNSAAAATVLAEDVENPPYPILNQLSYTSVSSVHSFNAPIDGSASTDAADTAGAGVKLAIGATAGTAPASSFSDCEDNGKNLSKKLTFLGSEIFESNGSSHNSQSQSSRKESPGAAALAALSQKKGYSTVSLDSAGDDGDSLLEQQQQQEYGEIVICSNQPTAEGNSYRSRSNSNVVGGGGAVQKFTFTGACMLADISGFSKFSGAKCSEGVSGLDDLREATNGFLGHIVKIVYDFEGDVIAFAGDALICVFLDKPTEEENAAATGDDDDADAKHPYGVTKNVNACYRALQCACVLRSHKTKYLSAHIGVSYGEMTIALLGGHNNQWVYLMNGRCVSELAGCIEDAGSEQVAATPECLELALQSPAVVAPSNEEDEQSLPPQQMGMIQKAKGSIDLHKEDSESDDDDGGSNLRPIKSTEFPNSKNLHIKAVRPLFKNALLQPMLKRGLSKGLTRRNSLTRSGKQTPSAVRHIELGVTQQAQQMLIESTIRFVPRPILTAIYSETLEHIGELRVVTTMFVSLDSYSPTLHRDPTTLQPFFLTAQRVLHESGGFLRQFLVDDKGCVFIAMWGMPSFTYANNSSRALFCGVSVSRRVQALGHKVSIGITTGNVFCGTVGAPERSDFAGIGTDVNMAARLMGKAKGRVLIDSNTFENLNEKSRKMLTPAEKMKLKGSDTPVVPYQFTAEDVPNIEAADDAPGMKAVLRRQVKAILGLQIDKIANSRGALSHNNGSSNSGRISGVSGNGAAVVGNNSSSGAVDDINGDKKPSACNFTIITGPPGTGKTTAVEYFRHSARKRNVQCIFIQARPGHEGVPYGLMRELFMELIGEDNFLTEAQQKQQINSLINQAYLNATEEERMQAMFSLELVLGLEWSIGRTVANANTTANTNDSARLNVLQRIGGASSNKLLPGSSGGQQSQNRSDKAQVAAAVAAAGAAAAAAALLHDNNDNSQLSATNKSNKSKSPPAKSPKPQKSPSSAQESPTNSSPGVGGSMLSFLGRSPSKKLDLQQQQQPEEQEEALAAVGIGSNSNNSNSSISSCRLTVAASNLGNLFGEIKSSTAGSSKKYAAVSDTHINELDSKQDGEIVDEVIDLSAEEESATAAASPAVTSPKAAAATATTIFPGTARSESTPSQQQQLQHNFVSRHLTPQLDAIAQARAATESGSATVASDSAITAAAALHLSSSSPIRSDDGREGGFNFLESSSNCTMSRPAGDLAFYRVLSVLINESTAIIIEDAQFCDELSWNELLLFLSGSGMNLSVLITVRSSSATATTTTAASSANLNTNASSSNNNYIISNANSRDLSGSSVHPHPHQVLSNPSLSNLNVNTPPAKGLSPSNSVLDNTPGSARGTGRRMSTLHNAINDSSQVPGQASTTASPGQSEGAESSSEPGRGVKFQSSPAYLNIVSHENTVVIEMTALSEMEVKELLLHALNVQSISNDLVKLVAEVSSGNAFWCKEIANFIKEKGVQQLEKTIQQGQTPHSALKVLILLRMEKLDLDQQVVLKHASVIGDEFSDRMLSALLPERLQADCSELLDSLVEEGFVFCLVEGAESIYAFQNQLIRETVYELIPPRDSAAVHWALAEYIEETYARNLRPFYPMLGMHYTKSIGKRALAFKFKVKAADQAISRGAFTDGLAFVEAAVTLAVTRPELRVLLDVINRALRDLNASSGGSSRIGQMSIGRRLSRSFNVGNPWDHANNRIAAYVQLKISVENSVEKLTVKSPEKRGVHGHSGSGHSNSGTGNGGSSGGTGFEAGVLLDARKNGFKTQHSAQLNWQPSYVASKMSDNSEADDDNSETKQQCCSIQ